MPRRAARPSGGYRCAGWLHQGLHVVDQQAVGQPVALEGRDQVAAYGDGARRRPAHGVARVSSRIVSGWQRPGRQVQGLEVRHNALRLRVLPGRRFCPAPCAGSRGSRRRRIAVIVEAAGRLGSPAGKTLSLRGPQAGCWVAQGAPPAHGRRRAGRAAGAAAASGCKPAGPSAACLFPKVGGEWRHKSGPSSIDQSIGLSVPGCLAAMCSAMSHEHVFNVPRLHTLKGEGKERRPHN